MGKQKKGIVCSDMNIGDNSTSSCDDESKLESNDKMTTSSAWELLLAPRSSKTIFSASTVDQVSKSACLPSNVTSTTMTKNFSKEHNYSDNLATSLSEKENHIEVQSVCTDISIAKRSRNFGQGRRLRRVQLTNASLSSVPRTNERTFRRQHRRVKLTTHSASVSASQRSGTNSTRQHQRTTSLGRFNSDLVSEAVEKKGEKQRNMKSPRLAVTSLRRKKLIE